LGYFVIFKKLPKVNNRPRGENSSNPVTLCSRTAPLSLTCLFFRALLSRRRPAAKPLLAVAGCAHGPTRHSEPNTGAKKNVPARDVVVIALSFPAAHQFESRAASATTATAEGRKNKKEVFPRFSSNRFQSSF
jgi:hypothetical protein